MLELKIDKLHPEAIKEIEFSRSAIEKIVKGEVTTVNRFGFSISVHGLQEILSDKRKIYPTLGDKLTEAIPKLEDIFKKHSSKELEKKIPFAETLSYIFAQDPVFGEVVTTVAAMQNDLAAKYYYMAGNFWRQFQHVSIDSLRFRDIYRGGSGYIYFPESISDEEGTEYQHFYFVSGNIQKHFGCERHRVNSEHPSGEDILMVALLSDNDGPTRIMGVQFPEDGDLRVKEFFAGSKEAVVKMDLQADNLIDVDIHENGYTPLISKILNVMAYIGTGEPDIREFQNIIRFRTPSSKIPVRADSHLSVKDINIVGYSWLKEKMISHHTDKWTVRPHLRWQRYGESYSKVKLITVKEHEKSWSS